jgi:hypothetical protein
MNPKNESGLHPGWETTLASVIETAGPFLANGTVSGLFLGDELCCSGVPFANLTNVADFAKARMQPFCGAATTTCGLIYTNECIRPLNDSYTGHIFYIPSIPKSIDIFSMDYYCADPKFGGSCQVGIVNEAAHVRKLYSQYIVPKLSSPHQRLWAIPGTFWDLNETRSGSRDKQDAEIAQKMDGYR